ncbi:hypothetical protein BGW36DRAFT_372530 [Talaromyces proteolyticus]|uniref:Fucose-specific lectin n=1 Tax=Talaromyces proteolyticus TaxID=1131652 RepID=A0AAD4Q1H6_9EURO|nr:uncharacterized protein BGW36DRAFT_372530 [Talaromyces proteolyticus]KAH8702289.1 hypothetical protein BGW36DRAFT_372530 [Talaromyces proteolyticus]
MSLAAAQNPLDPREALVFFYSHPSNNSALTNLGVYRRSLTGGENPPYRDFNIETSNLRLAPSGLVIAFYNGAPRVFGFSKADNDRSIVTQLSPTWTPIDDVSSGLVQGLWQPAIAAISDFSEDSAYVFYLASETVAKASLVRYNLSKYSPQYQRYDINANINSMLAAVKMRGSGNLRIFFQPETNSNYIHVYDIGNQTCKCPPPAVLIGIDSRISRSGTHSRH